MSYKNALELYRNISQAFYYPEKAFEMIGKAYNKQTRSCTFKTKKIGFNKVEVCVTPNEGIHEQPFQCQNRTGLLESISKAIKKNRPKIEHTECVFKGGNVCRYVISWPKTLSDIFKQVSNNAGLIFFLISFSAIVFFQLNYLTSFLPLVAVLSLLVIIGFFIGAKVENSELKSRMDRLWESSEKLLEKVENSYNIATVTNEIGQIISKQMTMEDILNKVIQISQKRLDYDRGLILLSNKERIKLQFRAGFGYTDEQLEILSKTDFHLDNPDSKGVFVVSFREQKPFLINDINTIESNLSPKSLEFTKKIGSKSFICCPVICDGISLGIFAVDNLNSKRPLVKSDMDLLMGIASFIGLSIRKAQLLHMQKMESIGTLSGGIAHDFNNMLGSIILNTEMALEDAPTKTDLRYSLDQVLKTSHRAKELVEQILTFSRDKDIERKTLKINVIVKETIKMLKAMIPATVKIEQNIDNSAGTILADPTQIQQLVMNLCTNAAQAMAKNGGMLKIELNNVKIEESASDSGLIPGLYLKLTISDTGHGINPENKERIFDPFFTTKQPGEGTGLGLSVVHGIVISHGGTITVDSKPGLGTTFEVFFQRVDSKVILSTKQRKSLPTGVENILYIDDEEALVDAGKRILERLGYRVTVSTCVIETIDMFRSAPEKFDIVITDMTMPNMTGLELSKELLLIRDDIPIIICTGYSHLLTKEKAESVGIREFVMKPFVMSDMAQLIRKILDEDSSDRRKHKRYRVENGIVSFSNSDFFKEGRILDISMGGIAFQYEDNEKRTNGFSPNMTISTEGFNLENVPIKTISDLVMQEELSLNSDTKRRCSALFGDLAESQIDQLEYFLKNHTVDCVN